MPSKNVGDPEGIPSAAGNDEFAQAFKDLARGEQTASALERQLSALEKKIEELLEWADQEQKEPVNMDRAKKSGGSQGRSSPRE